MNKGNRDSKRLREKTNFQTKSYVKRSVSYCGNVMRQRAQRKSLGADDCLGYCMDDGYCVDESQRASNRRKKKTLYLEESERRRKKGQSEVGTKN